VTSTAAALATDLVVADMIEAGAAGACVRIGGAMRVEGIGPRRAGWLTTAPPGRGGRTGAVLRLRQGAMVTGHATGSTGTGGPAAVGAIAGHAWRAEALVAAALAAPMPRARALVAGVATAGCLVGPDGRTVTVGRWADFAV
jgi:thiamine biosynthesis lipoprotein